MRCIASAVSAFAVVASANAVSAQSCAHPNVLAGVLQRAEAELPAMAEQLGIQGDVQVVVSLDAQSRVTNVAVQSSPSKILNRAALDAARASKFQTEIRNCLPVAVDYLYVVAFEPAGVEPFAGIVGAQSAPSLKVIERGSASRPPDLAVIRVTSSSRGSEKTVEVRARPGEQTVQAILNAVAAGATSISLRYAVSDDDGLYREALADAERAATLRAQNTPLSPPWVLGPRRFLQRLDYRKHATTRDRAVWIGADRTPLVPLQPAVLEAGAAVTAEYALTH